MISEKDSKRICESICSNINSICKSKEPTRIKLSLIDKQMELAELVISDTKLTCKKKSKKRKATFPVIKSEPSSPAETKSVSTQTQ